MDIDKNKGLLDQTYLSDELLSQIAGGAPINATPADYSITAQKFAAPVVIGKKSKNLFDKTTTTEGFYVSHSTGNLSASGNYAASDYIPVSPNTLYALSGTTIQLAFFNASKAYVSGIPNGVANPITTPATAAFVRLSMLKTEKDNVQLEVGPSATTYESYPTKITRDQLSFNIYGLS